MKRLTPQLSPLVAARRRTGFTLMEVLAALTIFAMGVVSIISLFPITTRIQSETIGDVMSQVVMRNAEVYLKSRPIPLWYLNNGGATSTITNILIATDPNPPYSPITVTYNNYSSYDVNTAMDVMELPKASGGFLGWLDADKGLYPLRDRSYPAVSTIGQHAYTWVPLVRRKRAPSSPPGVTSPSVEGELLATEWEVFVFVVRNQVLGRVETTAHPNPDISKVLKPVTGLPFPSFSPTDVGSLVRVERCGPEKGDLVATVEAVSPQVKISVPASFSIVGARAYIPGQILSAAITTTAELTRFDFVGFTNNPTAPDILPGQQVLMNDGTIYNVTRTDPSGKGFYIAGLVLPDAQGKYPNRVWFGAKGTAQLFRIEGADVIK